MKLESLKISIIFLLFCSLISINNAQVQNISNYSITLNLSHYLELLSANNSQIENKTIFANRNDLAGRKGGIVKGTAYEVYSRKHGYLNNFTIFDTYEEAQKALTNNSIDFFVCYKEIIGDLIQMYTDNLTFFQVEEELTENYTFGVLMHNNNTRLAQNLTSFFTGPSAPYLMSIYNNWLGLDEGLIFIPKIPKSPNSTQEICVTNFNQPPLAYKTDGEQLGMIPFFFQYFGNLSNFNISVKETMTDEDYAPMIKNGTVDAAFGFINKEDVNDTLMVVKSPFSAKASLAIRYENSEESKKWEIPNKISDFNGLNLGALNGQEDLVKGIFPNSNITGYSELITLFNGLLKERVEGVLVDKILLEYFKKRSSRITSYDDILVQNNSYGISFNNETLRNEFNDFLNNTFTENSLKSLFEEWRNANSSKTIDSNYTELNGTLNIEISFPNVRPMCYREGRFLKGYELDLLYRFAKEKGYNISHIQWGLETMNGTYQAHIGCQNISNTTGIYFSNPILNSSSVLAVRKDGIRSTLPLVVLDENYNKKNGNVMEFQAKANGTTINISCVFPSIFYNETINLNCSSPPIPNTTDIQYSSNDRLQILYSSIKLDNVVKSNKYFPNENILTISEAAFINIINNTNNTNTNDTSTDDTSINDTSTSDNSTNGTITSNSTLYQRRSSSGGLSTGAIIAIVIPSCIVVLGALGFALYSGLQPTQTEANTYPIQVVDNSANGFQINQQYNNTPNNMFVQRYNPYNNTGNNMIYNPQSNTTSYVIYQPKN